MDEERTDITWGGGGGLRSERCAPERLSVQRRRTGPAVVCFVLSGRARVRNDGEVHPIPSIHLHSLVRWSGAAPAVSALSLRPPEGEQSPRAQRHSDSPGQPARTSLRLTSSLPARPRLGILGPPAPLALRPPRRSPHAPPPVVVGVLRRRRWEVDGRAAAGMASGGSVSGTRQEGGRGVEGGGGLPVRGVGRERRGEAIAARGLANLARAGRPLPSLTPSLLAPSLCQVVFVATEVAPWSKVGGLGDVLAALPVALAAR
jgi:hypothetical protein